MLTHQFRGSTSRVLGRRQVSPLMLIGISVPLLLALIAGGAFLLPRLFTHAAAAVNMDCTLILPDNPLSAQGLATPFQLVATDPANGACHEANANQAAFAQGAIIDPVTGKISIYNPLVIDQGTQPAVQPTAPTLPPGAVVALWFGFNGNNLTLQGNTLNQANCVNGVNNSIFGQFSYCNAPAFFAVANQAIRAGKLTVPPLGTAKDGQPCPTVRDFSVVDQDQSDNVTTTYLITGQGQVAQNTAANTAALNNAGAGQQTQGPTMGMAGAAAQAQTAQAQQAAQISATKTQTNASDNRLLAVALDGALGCTPWMAPDLADNGNMVPALPLDELQAAAFQAAPIALVPLGDPMVLNNNQPDLNKVDMYRLGVDQPVAHTMADADTKTYCQNLLNIAPARLQLDSQFTKAAASPAADVANSLFTFLAQRFVATYGPNGLNCAALLNVPSPITVTTDGNGVATNATINVPNGTGTGTGTGTTTGMPTGMGTGTGTTPTCTVNGMTIAGCMGTTTINGQQCALAFANNTITVTCPPAQNAGATGAPAQGATGTGNGAQTTPVAGANGTGNTNAGGTGTGTGTTTGTTPTPGAGMTPTPGAGATPAPTTGTTGQ